MILIVNSKLNTTHTLKKLKVFIDKRYKQSSISLPPTASGGFRLFMAPNPEKSTTSSGLLIRATPLWEDFSRLQSHQRTSWARLGFRTIVLKNAAPDTFLEDFCVHGPNNGGSTASSGPSSENRGIPSEKLRSPRAKSSPTEMADIWEKSRSSAGT